MVVDEASRQRASETLLCLVNRERKLRHKPALRGSAQLATAATEHSADMVAGKFFSHTSPTAGSLFDRVARAGYMSSGGSATVGETLAWGAGSYATPAQMVVSFLESPVHRKTMLDKRFREVGIGLVLGAPVPGVAMAAATATMDFGRRR